MLGAEQLDGPQTAAALTQALAVLPRLSGPALPPVVQFILKAASEKQVKGGAMAAVRARMRAETCVTMQLLEVVRAPPPLVPIRGLPLENPDNPYGVALPHQADRNRNTLYFT